MPDEGDNHRGFVADFIDEKAETDDTDGEWPNTDSGKPSDLSLIEPELGAPFVEKKHSADEAEGGCDESYETAPENEFICSIFVHGIGFEKLKSEFPAYKMWASAKFEEAFAAEKRGEFDFDLVVFSCIIGRVCGDYLVGGVLASIRAV
jgi:hypothetical protein